ncbi:retrotransposon ORF1 [Tanacetum coccineum]
MENLNLFYQDIGPSSSVEGHLTQEEAAKEALAIRTSQKFALLEEERPVIETMAYHDKYKKILDEIWKDKVELDGKTVKEEEEAVKRIKGEALKEKDDPGAFIFPIRLEGKVNKNALADTGSDINTMSYRIYETLGREEMKKIDRGITMINHTRAEAMGKLSIVLCQVGITTIIAKFLILDITIDRDAPIVSVIKPCAARIRFLEEAGSDSVDEERLPDKRGIRLTIGTHDNEAESSRIHRFRQPTKQWQEFDLVGVARRLGLYQAIELDEDGFNVYFEGGLRSDDHFNAQEYWLSISREENLNLSRSHASTIKICHLLRHQNGYANVAWLIARWMKRKGAGTQKESQICCRHFITKLARKTKDLYDRMGRIEIRQEAIERMEYKEPITHLGSLPGQMGVSWRRYAVSSLMDTAYWMSEQVPIQGLSPINDSHKVSFDDDDVLRVLSLDSRFNAKKVMCGLMYRRGSSDDGNVVLCGFPAYVSRGSGSVGSIRRFDDDDILGVLSLDSRFNAKKVICGLMYRRGSPGDGNVVLCVCK